MPSVYSIGAKAIGAVTNSKPVKWTCNQFKKNFDNALIYTTMGSIVVKDGIGCVTYVKQSLNNEEIPEKRRSFVAALDLTNGVLMIVSQIALFLAMHKINKPMFDWIFRKSFSKGARKTLMTQTRMIQRAEGKASESINNVSKKLVIGHAHDKIRKDSLKIFEFVTDLVASAIIAKRVVVPLIATPLASIVEKKMKAKHDAAEGKSETEIKDKSNPTMQGAAKINIVSEPARVQTQSTSTNLLDKYKK